MKVYWYSHVDSSLELFLFGFFFQAEDGIRDLVRSRGLGDVYKRQDTMRGILRGDAEPSRNEPRPDLPEVDQADASHTAVSYTHLTLPTSDLV